MHGPKVVQQGRRLRALPNDKPETPPSRTKLGARISLIALAVFVCVLLINLGLTAAGVKLKDDSPIAILLGLSALGGLFGLIFVGPAFWYKEKGYPWWLALFLGPIFLILLRDRPAGQESAQEGNR